MATPMLTLCARLSRSLNLSKPGLLYHTVCSVSVDRSRLKSHLISNANIRHSSFFVQVPAEDLWKGVVGVSNAGKKKGRGKRVGRKRVTDLNRGQILGTGKANIQFPGLNAPVLRGSEIVRQKQLARDPERDAALINLRDKLGRIRYTANPPLLRGWSGSRFPGQSVGAPDPIAGYTFDGFDTRCLEFRLVTNMTGTLGRKMSFSAFVITGNKQGLAGFGFGKAQNGRAAIRLAKNRAAQRLKNISLYNNHTVFHNMYAENHHSKVFIHKREQGYGLRCHRAIRTICELIGIQDLHCKVEGNTKNVRAITNAFFDALTHQETHTELAERTGYNVVELSKQRHSLPVVVASPGSTVNTQPLRGNEVDNLEVDFETLYYGGKVELKRPVRPPRASGLTSWKIKEKEVHMMRNQKQAQLLRRAGLS